MGDSWVDGDGRYSGCDGCGCYAGKRGRDVAFADGVGIYHDGRSTVLDGGGEAVVDEVVGEEVDEIE